MASSSAGGSAVQGAAWDEIRTTARTWQYDRYLAATLAPRGCREDLIILAAFAGEIERIVHTVTEPTIAAIRLQWWRDALAATGDAGSGSPLADGLRTCIARSRLPLGLLVGHIDTQEIELYSDLVADLDELNLHFQKRDGALFDLALRLEGHAPAEAEREAIAAAARAYGLARTLAQLVWRVGSRQLLLPADICASHGLAAGGDTTAGRRCARDIVEQMSGAVTAERDALAAALLRVPAPSKRLLISALRPVALAETYLRFARRQLAAANPSETEPPAIARSWVMLKSYWLRKL